MNITGLGYLGFESPQVSEWRSFGPEIMAFGVAPSPAGDPDSVYLQMDDRRHRIAIHPGPVDRLAYIGWEISNRQGYEEAVAKLKNAGIVHEIADRALCDLRGVREMTRFKDPVGYQHEIFYAQKSELRSFKPPRKHAGFAADEKGIGHVILIVPALTDELEDFLFKVMGFNWFGGGSVSSGMKMGFYRPALSVRSHSIGYFQVPGKFGVQHIGLPVRELDDVGITFDIVQQRQVPLQMKLGRHTQDPVISFYVFTPSGFPVEYLYEFGPWNEMAEMNPEKVSLWGHERVGPLMPSTVRSV